MHIIIRSERWINSRTMADLITIGNNRLWFSKNEIIAYEINGVYKMRGLWGHGNHSNFLPNNVQEHRLDWIAFNSNLFINFWYLYNTVMSVYNDDAMRIERYAGDRANAFVLIIGPLKLYFSQGNFIAYRCNNSSPLQLCENWTRNGTVTKHINALVTREYPRIERSEFLKRFANDVPNIGAASRMEWCT